MILEDLYQLIKQIEREIAGLREKLRRLEKDAGELAKLKSVMGEMLTQHQTLSARHKNAMNQDVLNGNRAMQMFRQGMLGLLDNSGTQTANLNDSVGAVNMQMRQTNASISQSEQEIRQLSAQLSAYNADAETLAASAME